jgi:hypothetical protein
VRLGDLRIGRKFSVLREDGSISPVTYEVAKRGMYNVWALRVSGTPSKGLLKFDANTDIHVEVSDD